MKKREEVIIRVISSFVDGRTGERYRPGDVVVGWEADRAQRYAEEGLVEVVVKPAPATTTRSSAKPGPSQTKPKSGSTSKKAK